MQHGLAELVVRGTIHPAERARMGIPGRLRSRAQLLAPFAGTGSFAGLSVEHCEVFRLPETAWAAYGEHGNPERLGRERAGFFRSVFIPTLAEALDSARSAADRLAVADALEAALAHRMGAYLSEMPATGAIMVVTRQPN